MEKSLSCSLHGVKKNQIKKFIYSGKKYGVSSKNPKFFASSIVGGVISIALEQP